VAGKAAAKTGAKVAGKIFLRTATNPWLLAADGVELGVGAVCKKLDMDEDDARIVKKGSRLGASATIGAAVGGPVGGLEGLAIWALGKGFQNFLDGTNQQNDNRGKYNGTLSEYNSDACVPWDTSYICRDCGNEFGTNSLPKDLWEREEEGEWRGCPRTS